MLFLEFIRVVIKEGLVACHLIPDGHHANLIDCLLNTHRFYCKEKFFGNVEDFL